MSDTLSSLQMNLGLSVTYDAAINYAFQQNAIPVVKELRFRNDEAERKDLIIRVSTEPAFAAPAERGGSNHGSTSAVLPSQKLILPSISTQFEEEPEFECNCTCGQPAECLIYRPDPFCLSFESDSVQVLSEPKFADIQLNMPPPEHGNVRGRFSKGTRRATCGSEGVNCSAMPASERCSG